MTFFKITFKVRISPDLGKVNLSL